jgi:hypothetical protein
VDTVIPEVKGTFPFGEYDHDACEFKADGNPHFQRVKSDIMEETAFDNFEGTKTMRMFYTVKNITNPEVAFVMESFSRIKW